MLVRDEKRLRNILEAFVMICGKVHPRVREMSISMGRNSFSGQLPEASFPLKNIMVAEAETLSPSLADTGFECLDFNIVTALALDIADRLFFGENF
jgi:hypothetical protein